jgi:hypothetical protein
MKSVIDVCGDVSSNYLTNQSKEESRRTQKKHKQAAKKLKHVKEKKIKTADCIFLVVILASLFGSQSN